MKNPCWSLLMIIPSLAFGEGPMNQCSTAKVLTKIRPGAAWVMQADSMDKLKWLDTKQKKPSKSEVEKARQACVADMKDRDARKAQARQELKDPNTSTDKKVQDLILLLDMNR